MRIRSLIPRPLSVYDRITRKDPVKARVALPAADPPDNPLIDPRPTPDRLRDGPSRRGHG
ncbi:hypothetical protein FA743_04785 [Paracoccus gahaiensis]|uniref:Uncharacterized protein n=1 Tax=Paracoccus gahaiensis TaxID=1706839 RepID=A0A4U0RE23_9RHOB|nr:hypothetical protein FA743_04785 [Paracoccus gahaiensis]